MNILFFLMLSSMKCLSILEINPLFENSSSHSEGCLFAFLMVSFTVHKCCILTWGKWMRWRVGGRSKEERIYVCMWLIYFIVQQKLT